MKMIKEMMRKALLMPFFVLMGIDGDPPAGDATPPTDTPPGNDPPADDLRTLFTPEEVTAKKEAIAAAKAEEDRRAALTEEERAAEDAAKTEAEGKNKVPEEYADFKLPDGMELNKEMLALAAPLFKKAGLTQEMAQEFVDGYAKQQTEMVNQQIEKWEADKTARAEIIKADKEIGGDKLEESKEIANRFVNSFLNAEEAKELSDKMGYFGDIPVLIKLLTRAGKQIREGNIVQPGSVPASESERIANFYNKSEMK